MVTTKSDTYEQGPDWAKYQGAEGVFGQDADTFVIAQVGGYQGGYYTQATYNSQVSSARARGLHAHTYIWLQVGGDVALAKQVAQHFVPLIKTPKGSIVAMDYEDGASGSKANNTAAIIAAMQVVKDAGYTPMYYSYKPYTQQHVDAAAIIKRFGTCIWIAGYPDYNVRTKPLWQYFPSMDGVAIWQFTSMYRAGGLDGNVDLTGITRNGYAAKPIATPKKEDEETVETTNNIVTISHVPGAEIPVYDKNGKRIKAKGYTNGTKHTSKAIYITAAGTCFYDGKVFIPIAYTHYAHAVIVNYGKGYGIVAVDKDGKQIAGSNKKFLAGTAWNWSKCIRIGKENYFQVSSTEFIPANYVQGGGYK